MEYSLIRLTDRPELKAQAAAWFHAKWGVPEQALCRSGIWCWRVRASSAAWA